MFGTTCVTCRRIRMFLVIAAGLIVMIGMKPAGMVELAGRLPAIDVIAWGMMAAGSVAFAIRYWQYRKSRD
jgi:hypothetical protein